MIFTPFDANRFRLNPNSFMQEISEKSKNGDTQIIFSEEPIIKEYQKDEGILYIVNKISNLDVLTTEKIALSVKEYADFMKEHRISIIKEYDTHCKMAYSGEIPNINVENFTTQSFCGFNKFQIIDAHTLERNIQENDIYIKPIDFTYAMDSNIASYLGKFIEKNESYSQYKSLYEEIIKDENNIDISPYIFENVINGIRDFGINFKLNKNNKNETQKGFFENLKRLHESKIFKEKNCKKFINKIIKDNNHILDKYGICYYQSYIFLMLMIEAKFLFGKSTNKLIKHVFTEMRKLSIPIENKLKAILYIFVENPNHNFFNKVINVKNIRNIDTYLKKVDNTSRDIAIILLERYIYDILDVFSFIATNDQALIQILQDTKPDFIIKIDKFKMPIYRSIDDDIHRKYNQIFSINKAYNFLLFENLTLKEIFEKYKNKKNEFIKKISN